MSGAAHDVALSRHMPSLVLFPFAVCGLQLRIKANVILDTNRHSSKGPTWDIFKSNTGLSFGNHHARNCFLNQTKLELNTIVIYSLFESTLIKVCEFCIDRKKYSHQTKFQLQKQI